ncbi:class I SAM-dependent methyltransferase [Hydrogenophilus islandicus]
MPHLPPLMQAFLAQLAGWLAVFLWVQAGGTIGSPWVVVTLQGTTAALTAWLLRSPRWWLPIHLLFMPAVLAAQRLEISPLWYLAAFLLLLLIFRNVFTTRVPLYLSNARAVEAIAAHLPKNRPFRFLDLGSGTGALLLPLARRFPNGTFIGIENAPLPLWIAKRQGQGQKNLTYRAADFFAEPWTGYDYLYAFLSPAPMARVEGKAERELPPGAVLISNTFPLPHAEPFRVEPLDEAGRRVLYWYRF